MKCFWDIDDVLADTSSYAFKFHKKENPLLTSPNLLGSRQIHKMVNMSWERFWYDLPMSFWSSIPKMKWADSVVNESINFFGVDNVFFLTSPIRTAACAGGKMEWVVKNYPKLAHNLIIAHPKWDLVDKSSILIDDSYSNQEEFIKLGKEKQFFLFPSLQNIKHSYIPTYNIEPSLALFDIRQLFKELISGN